MNKIAKGSTWMLPHPLISVRKRLVSAFVAPLFSFTLPQVEERPIWQSAWETSGIALLWLDKYPRMQCLLHLLMSRRPEVTWSVCLKLHGIYYQWESRYCHLTSWYISQLAQNMQGRDMMDAPSPAFPHGQVERGQYLEPKSLIWITSIILSPFSPWGKQET